MAYQNYETRDIMPSKIWDEITFPFPTFKCGEYDEVQIPSAVFFDFWCNNEMTTAPDKVFGNGIPIKL